MYLLRVLQDYCSDNLVLVGYNEVQKFSVRIFTRYSSITLHISSSARYVNKYLIFQLCVISLPFPIIFMDYLWCALHPLPSGFWWIILLFSLCLVVFSPLHSFVPLYFHYLDLTCLVLVSIDGFVLLGMVNLYSQES